MAIPTVTIQGKVVAPNGAGIAKGTVTAKLSQAGSVLDGAVSQRVASSTRVTLGSDGALPAFALIPNDAIVPSGTYYRVRFSTEGATIYYTTDGSTPTSGSLLYPGPISVTATTTLKAIAIKSGMTDSAVATAAYVIGAVPVVDDPYDTNTIANYTASGASSDYAVSGGVLHSSIHPDVAWRFLTHNSTA